MRLSIGSHALAYDLVGQGPRTVTLTHGIASYRGTWGAIANSLAPSARVLTWDLRAHGESDTPTGPYALSDFASDLLGLLDGLRIERTVLVGHSAGGLVAMKFALEHGDRLDALVLMSTASEANRAGFELYERFARVAEETGSTRVQDFFLSEDGAPAPDAAGFAWMARAIATVHENPLTPQLAAIRCPVTVLVGTGDPIGVGGSVKIHRAIAGSKLEILAGLNHVIHLEDPERISRLLSEAIARAG
jgi:pimeloyl-ACP methyl ester carboxylesterase